MSGISYSPLTITRLPLKRLRIKAQEVGRILQFHPILPNCRAELESKQTSLLQIVQSLNDYIQDDDPTIRAKAVQYLSLVIGAIPSNCLNIQQVQVLCEFLCAQLDNGGAVGALRKLSGLRKFTKDMAKMTIRA